MYLQHVYRTISSDTSVFYAWFSAMHTRIDILLATGFQKDQLITVCSDIQQIVADVEHTANCFHARSELSVVNRLAYTQPVPLSPMLEDILQACIYYNRLTHGLFDITTDSDGYIQNTIQQIQLFRHQIRFQRVGIRINLSGFLKGYALDSIRQLLLRHEVCNAIVSMGNSSVLAMGSRMGMEGWPVTLQQNGATVILKDQCLTTSGNDSADRRHIVNPMSGQPVMGKRSVTVTTKDGAVGEVLSTCMFIANPEQRAAILQHLHADQVIDTK